MSEKTRNPRSIRYSVLLYMTWRNLTHKKMRTTLTLMGIIIGVSSIFFLLSAGMGLQNLVTQQVIGNQTLTSVDVTSDHPKVLKLDRDNMEKIRELPGISKIGVSYSYAGSISVDSDQPGAGDTNERTKTGGNSNSGGTNPNANKNQNAGTISGIVYGTDDQYRSMLGINIINGRDIRDKDTTTAIVSRTSLSAMGLKEPSDILGKRLTLFVPLKGTSKTNKEITKTFTVVGVMDSQSGTEIFTSSTVFDAAGVGAFSRLKVDANSKEDVAGIRSMIESYGFTTTSLTDTISEIKRLFRIFTIFLGCLGIIGMIIAVLGMFNMLTVSLLEKTKEIGLMISMGARKTDASKLFITEAGVLSLIGAILGVIVAFGLGKITDYILNLWARGRGVLDAFTLFSTPLWLIGVVTAFMLAVGLLVSYFPSSRARKVNPVEVLR